MARTVITPVLKLPNPLPIFRFTPLSRPPFNPLQLQHLCVLATPRHSIPPPPSICIPLSPRTPFSSCVQLSRIYCETMQNTRQQAKVQFYQLLLYLLRLTTLNGLKYKENLIKCVCCTYIHTIYIEG